jgi:hypothetical protein
MYQKHNVKIKTFHKKDVNQSIKNSLISLDMFTYTCERPNIIQFALKGLPGRGKCRKKNFVR